VSPAYSSMHHFVQKGHRNIFFIWIDVDFSLTPFASTVIICGKHLVLWQATTKIKLVILGEQTLEILALADIQNEL
jgi:hypothetical protein